MNKSVKVLLLKNRIELESLINLTQLSETRLNFENSIKIILSHKV